MDLDTENRIAAMLLKEAAELRRQAEREGVLAYLKQPKARGRPNSRFLTATVLGVQQANRAVEVNELWRVRQKELELDDRLSGRSRPGYSSSSSSSRNKRDVGHSVEGTSKRHVVNEDDGGASSSKRVFENCHSREDDGLRDEEVEEFLLSRAKRGRGAIGSRMDETGPYLPSCPDSRESLSTGLDVREHRVFGPERPSSLKSCGSSEEEVYHNKRKNAKKHGSRTSDKKKSDRHGHREKSRTKEKSRDKKNKRKEKKSRHS